MFVIASQIIICLFIAALLGVIFGYILGKENCSKKACDKTEISTHELHIDNKKTLTVKTTSNTESATDKDKEEEKSPIEKETLIVPEVKIAKEESQKEEPLLLSEPRTEGKDNLQLIKGIGKVLEKVLNEKGFFHFDQIANLTEEQTTWLDKSISFPGRIKREKWIEQAQDLAERLTHDTSPKDS